MSSKLLFNNKLCIFIITTFLIFAGFSTLVLADEEIPTIEKIENLQQKIIKLILKSSVSLKSQQQIIAKYQNLDYTHDKLTPSLGVNADLGAKVEDYQFQPDSQLELSMSLPLLSLKEKSKKIEDRLEKIIDDGENIQNLEKMQKELIADLIEELKELMEFVHKIKGQKKLITLLKDQKDQLQGLIKNGTADFEDLWEIEERIISNKVKLADYKASSKISITEITTKYGGDNQDQLNQLLKQLVSYYKTVKSERL